MYDYLDDRQIKRLKELVPYKILAPNADEIIKELERLNNIIDELEKWLKKEHENGYEVYYLMAIQDILDKLKALKGNNNE